MVPFEFTVTSPVDVIVNPLSRLKYLIRGSELDCRLDPSEHRTT